MTPAAPLIPDYASPSQRRPPVRPSVRKWALIGLLVLGVQLWLIAEKGIWGRNFQLQLLVVIAILTLIPPLRRFLLARCLDAIRSPSARQRRAAMAAVAITSCIYVYATARYQGHYFVPVANDEYSYLLGARQLASGHLWMPAHPLGRFFDSTFIITDRAYASCYFPGTAMLLVPGVWLGFPFFVTPLVIAGLAAGLFYRIVCELVDGVAAVLAWVMLLGLDTYRVVSLTALSQMPAMMLGLALVWAYLHWRKSRAARWEVVIGLVAGWLAITRPLDAVCLSLPVGVAMALDLRRRTGATSLWRRTMSLTIATAAPLLLIQLISNIGITGHWWQFPYDYYVSRELPGTTLGFHAPNPQASPASPSPLKRDQFQWVQSQSVKHTWGNILTDLWKNRLPVFVRFTIPMPLLIVLLPAGCMGLSRRRWVLVCTAPLFFCAYALFTFFLDHYPLVVAPGMILLVLLGALAIVETFPRAADYWKTSIPLIIAMLSLTSMAEFNRLVGDQGRDVGALLKTQRALDGLEHKPAVVLFPYSADTGYLMRVYTLDTAWPDDAKVIQANDLGPAENAAIFAYYARRQPHRAFYRYDYHTGAAHYLGTAADLANDQR